MEAVVPRQEQRLSGQSHPAKPRINAKSTSSDLPGRLRDLCACPPWRAPLCSLWSAFSAGRPPLLIESPVIRIRRKSFGISADFYPSRRLLHATQINATSITSNPPSRLCGLCGSLCPLCSAFSDRLAKHDQATRIATPAIRNLSKSFRISARRRSNRHKIRLLDPGQFSGTPRFAVGSHESSFAGHGSGISGAPHVS